MIYALHSKRHYRQTLSPNFVSHGFRFGDHMTTKKISNSRQQCVLMFSEVTDYISCVTVLCSHDIPHKVEPLTSKPCAAAGYFYPHALPQSIPAYLVNALNAFSADKVKGMTVREAMQHRVNIVMFACHKFNSKKENIFPAF